jgi:putative hydrolase of HD superfamily
VTTSRAAAIFKFKKSSTTFLKGGNSEMNSTGSDVEAGPAPESITVAAGSVAHRGILDAALSVTRHAAEFARIERAVVTHTDGTAETDSDHTVHLSWLAPALAAATEPALDPDLVAAYAAVHDAVEVFAGDTPTITITDTERARKHAREKAAQQQWHDDLGVRLPWLPAMIDRYESQADPEARFVKAADKIAPKLLHYLNRARDLYAAGVTPGQFHDMISEQRAALGRYAAEFSALLGVYDHVTTAVHQALAGLADGGSTRPEVTA